MLLVRASINNLRRHLSISAGQLNPNAGMTATWSAFCLTSESSDTNLSICMDYNSSRYLFNCGEGTTRALLQRRKGFRKFKALFVTEINTDKSAGLPGILMTMADANITKTHVVGPSGLHHFLASTRLYAMRETLSVDTKEISDAASSCVYKDENITVIGVPLFSNNKSPEFNVPHLKRKELGSSSPSPPPPKRTRANSSDNKSRTHRRSPERTENQRLQIIQQMFGGASSRSPSPQPQSGSSRHRSKLLSLFEKPLPRFEHDPPIICYIVTGIQGRGKFDAVRAKGLGLKNGPIRAKLARGETVVTDDGRRITPDMVLGPTPDPDVFVFVDCPSPEYIPSLERSETLRAYQKDGKYPAHCIIHLLGEGVLEDARYKAWLGLFGESTHHLFAGSHLTPDRICFTSTAYAQLRLSHLDKAMFPVPKCRSSPVFSYDPPITLLRHNHYIPMKPKNAPLLPPDNDGIDLFHPAIEGGGVDDVFSFLTEKTVTVYQHAQKLVEEHQNKRVVRAGDEVTIIPLGTSSAMPSKYRNVSSLLLRYPNGKSILLDCGEGTLGQLYRQFGVDAPSVLQNVHCVFISHIHADHHMGLSKLLSKRRKLIPSCTSPIYLIANQATAMYLREYNDLEDLGYNDSTSGLRIIPAESIHGNLDRMSADVRRDCGDLEAKLDVSSIKTVIVPHRGRCFGIVIKHREGWSIVYSGDTKPSEELIRAGRGATLLIHEATLGDDQKEMAEAKGHSTIGQAVDVGKRMGAQNILLTHFSNRFPKTPQFVTESGDDLPIVAVAFDNSPVRIGDMWKLACYLPAIEQSFMDSEDPADEVVENDMKQEV